MVWLLLPLLFTIAAWGVGRVILRSARGAPGCEGTAVFLGLAAMLAVLSWCTFAFGLSMRSARYVLLPLILVTVVLGHRQLRAPSWRELGAVALVLLAVVLHYVWPAKHAHADIALFSAGDFNQYIGVGTWLRDHAITDGVDYGLGYSPLQANVADHQASHLRIGALLLLALFGSFGRADVPAVYSAYTAFILGLQALAVMLLARRLAPALPAWVATLAALVFGISPTPTWAAYAAFVPQTLGLAFLVATVATLVWLVEAQPAQPLPWRAALVRTVPVGLLAFAAWSCYPEAVPLGGLVSLCYLAFALAPRWRDPLAQRAVLQVAAGALLVWILASPLNFWWGLQGMQAQLNGVAHGAEQDVSFWSLLAMTLGAQGQPLTGTGTVFSEGWFPAVSLACCGAGLLGVGALLARRERALASAIAASGVFLFAFVLQHYSQGRIGHLPDWRAMATWNLFKAATYLCPFLLPAALVGLATLGQRVARTPGLLALPLLMAAALVAVALKQDDWVEAKINVVRIPRALRTLTAQIPPGRLLLDIHNIQNEADYYQRYAIYGLLGSRAFVSSRDWQPFHIYTPRDIANDKVRDSFLSKPFQYVLSDRPNRYVDARTVATAGPYNLLDVSREDFSVYLQEWSRPPQLLLNLAPSKQVRAVAASIFNLPPTKVLYDIFDHLQELETKGANPFVLQVPAEPRGGLALVSLEPSPVLPPQVVLRGGELPAVPQVKVDLMPLLLENQISTDPEGRVMHLERSEGIVRLTMPQAGTSRALVVADVEPGEYLLHLEVGNVTVREHGETGFGAFFGPENSLQNTVELHSGTHHYLRVVATKNERALFAIGFGGWGRGSGSIEVKKLELVLLPPRR